MSDSSDLQLSPDGLYWWDGSRWQSRFSADRRWRWDGHEWTAVQSVSTQFERTYNPMRALDSRSRVGPWNRLPSVEPGAALVVHRDGEKLSVHWPPTAEGPAATSQREAGGSVAAMFRTTRNVYKVDTTDHTLEFDCELPGPRDEFRFIGQLNLNCAVRDPAIIVARGIIDVGATLGPLLMKTMRDVSRTIKLEESLTAEGAILRELEHREASVAGGAGGGIHPGFRLTGMVLKVDLDRASREHHDQVQRLQRGQEQVKAHGELESLKLEIDLQRSVQLRELVQSGQWQMLALRLAQDQQRIPEVLQAMTEERRWQFDNVEKAARFLLDNDIIEKSQFGEASSEMVSRILSRFGLAGRAGPPELELPSEDPDGGTGDEAVT